MTRAERFELEIHARVTLSRYATRLKVCGLDLHTLLHAHAGCGVRGLVIGALQAELMNTKGQLPHRSLIEDVIDEWLSAPR